jgi:uncharacterized protein
MQAGSGPISELKFIVDHNVGKLTKQLRMMGFDTVFFNGEDDAQMVAQALAEGRMMLTRDTGIMKRRVVTGGRVKAILIASERPDQQIHQLMESLHLEQQQQPLTRCLECNQLLEDKTPGEVQGRVPPYVYKTQSQYRECPGCHRIYWRGTHWLAITRKLGGFLNGKDDLQKWGGKNERL